MDPIRLNLSSADVSLKSAPVPDITGALNWRRLGDGIAEAQARRIPIFVLAEPRWSNSAQRLAHVLEGDEQLRNRLEHDVVPVMVDPNERPDVCVTWRWAAVALTGSSGPPLLLLLTHEGMPFLSYGSMQFEGDDTMPSLGSLVAATADAYSEHMESFLQEARALARSSQDVFGFSTFSEYWGALQPEIDTIHGGLHELPRHPHPQLLISALEAGTRSDDIMTWVRTTLRRMRDGGINDQLDHGFHRCARDDRWVLPHFEKPVPLNAQLTVVYARAATVCDDPEFHAVAETLAVFCISALQEDIDCVASDSAYYTWTSEELLNSLDPVYVQPMSLRFGVVPSPLRQTLRRSIRLEQLEQYSREDQTVLRDRVERGRTQLLKVRQRRRSPEVVTMPGYSWRAETLRWLFIAAKWIPDIKLVFLEQSLATLLGPGLNAEQGYLRPGQDSGWLEDQAAVLGAMMAAYRATGSHHWRKEAQVIADVLVRSYQTEDGWRDRVGEASPSRAIVDEILPSAIGTVTSSLAHLHQDNPEYTAVAKSQAEHYLEMAEATREKTASFWRAWHMIAQSQ